MLEGSLKDPDVKIFLESVRNQESRAPRHEAKLRSEQLNRTVAMAPTTMSILPYRMSGFRLRKASVNCIADGQQGCKNYSLSLDSR